jgi:transcriptional regulator with PAS, ATPase and Fis domain
MPPLKLDENAIQLLQKFRWSGNIRQLRNVAEQLSVLETSRDINAITLQSYLPSEGSNLPSVVSDKKSDSDFNTEREILYKVLFDMKSDLHDLKKLTLELMKNGTSKVQETNQNLIKKIYGNQESDNEIHFEETPRAAILNAPEEEEEYDEADDNYLFAETIEAEEEILKLEQKEIEMIKRSLEKNKGKRKAAADELGISERTLYRKIKQFDL